MDSLDPPKRRPPLHIRLMARWALISLLIAGSGLLLATLQPPSWITAGLKVVIGAASTIGVASLLLWVAFSGLHFAFSKRDEEQVESDFF